MNKLKYTVALYDTKTGEFLSYASRSMQHSGNYKTKKAALKLAQEINDKNDSNITALVESGYFA